MKIKSMWCFIFGHRWYGVGWDSNHFNKEIPEAVGIRNLWQCGTCRRRIPTDGYGSKIEDIKRIGFCDGCRKLKRNVKRHEWDTGPGSGRYEYLCPTCWPNRPKGFMEIMGISNSMKQGAQFVKFVGEPQITDNRYGMNAWGSVLALYDDGSKLAVICDHGGSAWLCLSCAENMINKENINGSPRS